MSGLLKQPLKLALIQLATGTDKAQNLARARSRVLEASAAGAKLIVLPECFNSPYGTQFFPKYAETLLPDPPSEEQSPTYHLLSSLAKETSSYLLGGSIPELAAAASTTQSNPSTSTSTPSPPKYHNTSLLFGPQGTLLATHRKLHLFDISIPNKITFRESDVLSPGNKLTLATLPDHGTIAMAICYDIRFPEMATIASRPSSHPSSSSPSEPDAQQAQQPGAFLLLYPGAFNLTTGPMHWSLLARARAVDNQVYVALCSPARDMQAEYKAYGHSMVVAPDASVVAEAGEGEEIVYAELRGQEIDDIRRGIPVQTQRRFDVYPDISKGDIRFEE